MIFVGLSLLLVTVKGRLKKWSSLRRLYFYLKSVNNVRDHCNEPNQQQNTPLILRVAMNLLKISTCFSGSLVGRTTMISFVILTQ